MKKLKVFLIEPIIGNHSEKKILISTPNFNNYGSGVPSGVWEPYSIECIGSYIKNHLPVINLEILQEDISNYNGIIQKLRFNTHDINIVCISMYTYTVNYALKFFKSIKKDNVITVAGGYHPSGDPSIANNEYVDYAIGGEGEIPLLKLIQTILDGHYPDYSYIQDEEKINMTDFIWPYRYVKYLGRARSYPLAYPPPLEQINPSMITYGRGCYFNCPFCASSTIWPNTNISYRPVEDVIKEIKFLQNKFGTNLLFWSDLAINNDKTKTKNLLHGLIDANLKINSFGYANQNLDYDTARLLKKAGFSRVGFGVEALKTKRLGEIKKFQKVDTIKNALEVADENGILTRAYLMIGFPDQEPKDTYEILDIATDLPIDQLRLGFYTPFVGTQTYHKYKDDLTTQYDRFTSDLPVFKHHIERENDWIKIRDEILDKFYKSQEYSKRVETKIRKYTHLKNSYKFFLNEFKKFGSGS